MARKLKNVADDVDDLAVLHPERGATIAGRAITVREYGFVESLKLHGLIQPILLDLRAALASSAAPTLDDVIDLLAGHHEALVQLMAIAADVEPAWIATLNADDGQELLYLWWGANGPFWLRSVVQRLAAERMAHQAAALREISAGAPSTPSSLPLDMATPALSDA